jgi:Malate synthase
MTDRTQCGGLQVATELYQFINDHALPGTGLDPNAFWSGVDTLIHDLAPINRDLLAKRDALQEKIDAYHKAHAGQPHDAQAYKAFLEDIGYLLPEPQNVQVDTGAR